MHPLSIGPTHFLLHALGRREVTHAECAERVPTPCTHSRQCIHEQQGGCSYCDNRATLLGLEAMLNPRADPCSQKRKALLMQCLCRVCCLTLGRGFSMLRTRWGELPPPTQWAIFLCCS